MPRFMLIVQQKPDAMDTLSPEEMQRMVGRFQAWMADLQAAGRYVASDKLMEEGGRVVRREGGRLAVVDGPSSEAREVIGGYCTIRAADYAEAEAIARDCPFAQHSTLVIRRCDPMGCGGE